jgi:hypothetical protein
MGRNSNLKYGARLIHSVLGDNSTVSCCEMLNNLIFPIHEQHHNNSFLIAGLIQGLSNIAAGATIGSNHNSRANDGELRAGRGFWPGLSVTLKHSSRFASFILLSKGDYPYELNITLPFSLINNNIKKDRLEILPAYFWMYNLYALERNSFKAIDRDKRKIKIQHIETDYLAPDTAEEIIAAIRQIETWIADPEKKWKNTAKYDENNIPPPAANTEDPEYDSSSAEEDTVNAPGLERSKRRTVILKPLAAIEAYRVMLRFYAVKTLAGFFAAKPDCDFEIFSAALAGTMPENASRSELYFENRLKDWVNFGGQIVPAFRIDALRKDIREKKITAWDQIHTIYGQWFAEYPLDKARHAWAVLAWLRRDNSPFLDKDSFKAELEKALVTRKWITSQVYETRAKDFNDPFRGITYRNKAEMEKVAGNPTDNFFVRHSREDEKAFEKLIKNVIDKL